MEDQESNDNVYSVLEIEDTKQNMHSDLIQIEDPGKQKVRRQKNLLSNESQSSS